MESGEFGAYVRRRTPALLRYAHVLTGDASRAEDLVQGALAATYRKWASVQDPDAYVRRAVLHAHLNRRMRLLRREHVTDVLPEVPGAAARSEERLDLIRALATLPKRQRAVVVLRYFEDLTEAQTAEAMGVSVGTVKSTHAKALAALRGRAELREDNRR